MYDDDGNDFLDFTEAGKFLREYMKTIGVTHNLETDVIKEVFEEFDYDNSMSIDKEEMIAFINILL